MRLSIFVNLVGRCNGLLAIFTLVALLPSRVVSNGGAAIADPCRTRILHCYYIPTKVQMGLACYCLPLACYCLPLACYCLPLACYCLSLTAYPLLLLPLTRLLTISAYPLACYCLPFTRAACRCCPCYCTHVCREQDRQPIWSMGLPLL